MHRSTLLRVLAPATLAAALLGPTALSDEYSGAVTSTVVLKTTRTAAGQPIAYPKGEAAEVTASVVTIAPGAETGWHTHAVPLYVWVAAGKVRVEYDGAPAVTVKAGEALVEAVGVAHNGRNEGSEPAKLLVFTAGFEGKPNVAKAARPAPAPR